MLAAAAASSSQPPLIPQPVMSHKSASKHALSYRKSGNYDNVRSNIIANGFVPAASQNSAVLSSSSSSSGSAGSSGIKAAAHSLRSSQRGQQQAAAMSNGYVGQRLGSSTVHDNKDYGGSLLKQPTKLPNGVHMPSKTISTPSAAVQNGTANENFGFPHRTVVTLGASR